MTENCFTNTSPLYQCTVQKRIKLHFYLAILRFSGQGTFDTGLHYNVTVKGQTARYHTRMRWAVFAYFMPWNLIFHYLVLQQSTQQ